jgi:hypothetical protein
VGTAGPVKLQLEAGTVEFMTIAGTPGFNPDEAFSFRLRVLRTNYFGSQRVFEAGGEHAIYRDMFVVNCSIKRSWPPPPGARAVL